MGAAGLRVPVQHRVQRHVHSTSLPGYWSEARRKTFFDCSLSRQLTVWAPQTNLLSTKNVFDWSLARKPTSLTQKCVLPGPTWKPLSSCEGDYLRFYSPPMPSVTKTEAQDRLKDGKVLISNISELRFDERFCWTNKANFTFGLSDQLFVQFRSHSLLFTFNNICGHE